MKIKVTDTVKSYDGKEVIENGQPLLLRTVFDTSLNNTIPGEDAMTSEQKAKAYQLTLKIYANNEVDLTLDDRTLLKERVGKVYNPLVFGRVSDLLEGSDKTTDSKKG